MDWLKKNLALVVSGLVALVVIGAAAVYLYSKIQKDGEVETELSDIRQRLATLEGSVPYPNRENLEAAQAQLGELTNFMKTACQYFGTINTNPPPNNTQFISMLAETLGELRRSAQAANVTLPTNFAFSFTAQRELTVFDTTNMASVVSQVEDVRALSHVLFDAKIYEIIGIQRARVSANDTNASTAGGNASDYLLSKKIVTDDISSRAPYVATFRCTAPELAAVIEGLARARYGFFVKSVKVEPGDVSAEGESGGGADMNTSGGMANYMRMRYGLGGRYGRPTAAGPAEGGDASANTAEKEAKKVGVVLKEKPIKVAVLMEVIKIARAL